MKIASLNERRTSDTRALRARRDYNLAAREQTLMYIASMAFFVIAQGEDLLSCMTLNS